MTPPNSLSKVDPTLNQSKKLLTGSSNLPSKQKRDRQPTGLSLGVKVILTAIALGIIPVTVIGAISYKVTQSQITRQINQNQQSRTDHMAEMFEKYLNNRAKEAETLATSPIFTNPNVMSVVTVGQKKAALDVFQDKTGFYDSIVYLDLQGNPLFQSQSEPPSRQNQSQQKYFQNAIKNKITAIDELNISSDTGEPRIEFAVPVKNAWTDQVIGVLRFRIPSQKIMPLLEDYRSADEQIYLINTQSTFFASTFNNLENQPLTNYFPELQQAHITKQTAAELVNSPIDRDREQIINYAPIKIGTINPELNLGTAIAIDTDIAFAPLKSLKWIYLGGTIGTALLVGTIAGFLANRIIQPLVKLTSAVNELSQGKLDTRIKINRQDELALLGDRINNMAMQLEGAMQRQKTIARSSELMARISQARSSRELQLPFSLFLTEVRNFIKADRVIFYRFDEKWRGTVVAESVAQGLTRTLGVQFDDSCFAKEYVRKYQRGRIQAVSDIYQANLTDCHLKQLEPYGVKASLVLPVILEQPTTPDSERLIGLLIAHQCSSTRVWSQSNVDYFQQVAYQLAMVLRGYIVCKEENWQTASTQKDLSRVLTTMKDIARGDLRANLTSQSRPASDITQSFNLILNNLRESIAQIQTPSREISRELRENQQDLAQMKDRLKEQANQLALIFAFIEQISNSILEVSSQVGIASQTVDSVVTDLESEKVNFGHAIAFMSQLETNLRTNRDKVKNLSTASQKMTRVIGSIRKINLRASLLASKLSKRIPELDESAFGLKEEIKSIQQSITATKELENVLRGIDNEVREVLREYQKSENQIEQENYLVANGSKNLEQIVRVTKNAQQNLFSLVNMTKMQQQTFQKIDNLKGELNETSESITILSDRTIKSIEQTSITAKDLENVVNFFKLEQKTTTDYQLGNTN
ncbi:HAMP domain-containing protein [Waterburya agarophytonicola K14]|uniref:HAMP domain-containing protein n=1 Tax=Waterburya agarophytonicola KI4 TaxID=2874699 RepID=A0A964BMZ8_9CYAN|nr:cache domain-containing protein [Waterburya agarophytonicola]MCC0175641.1 HAMP domain-containing protein [Waterburya agarophytonicola KI4]